MVIVFVSLALVTRHVPRSSAAEARAPAAAGR
jgi:hypothetical protein